MPFKNAEDRRENRREWCRKNYAKYNARQKQYYNENVAKYLFITAKTRAKQKGLPFTITEADIDVPEFCPVLGIKLERGSRGFHNTAPSVDRIHPALGYVPGNVRVISYRANSLKKDATLEELEAVTAYVRAHKKEGGPEEPPQVSQTEN